MAKKVLDGVLHHIRKLAAVQTYREWGDRELLEQFVTAKDEAAFTVLVERHGLMVLGVCRRTLGNTHDAEDACQACFLVLAQKAVSIRKSTSLSSWLHGVASRIAANLKRERLRRCRRERQSRKPALPDPAAEVSWREVQAILDEELVKLPERWRAPLIICYLEGHTRDQAAQQLALTPGCLHGRLERGRLALCQRLKRRGVSLSAALLASALGESVSGAALSPTAVLATAGAAVQLAIGRALDRGLVSADVVSLAQEVFRNMFLTKLKMTAVLCAGLLCSVIGGSLAAVGTTQNAQSPSPTETQTSPILADQRVSPSPVDAGDAASKDAKALEGEWAVVGLEWDGKKVPSFEVRSQPILFTFKGKEVNSSWLGKGKFAFKLDAARSPKVIDFSPLGGQWQGRMRGIYLLEDGRLRLCLKGPSKDGEPPTEFKTRRGDNGLRVFVLKRVVPKGPASSPPAEVAAAEFGAVLREWRHLEESYRAPFQSGTTRQQQQKVQAEKAPKLDAFAGRCLKLAEGQDSPAGLAALCWAVSNAPASEAGKKALAVLKGGRIARAGVEELGDALGLGAAAYLNTSLMTAQIKQELAPLVLGRVKQCLDHPRAAEVITWVCTCFMDEEPAQAPHTFTEAADLIASRFADSPDINHLCEVLGVSRKPPWARRFEKHLRAILKANHHAHVRLEAEFALASILQEMEGRQEEARKLYQRFVEDYTGRAQHDGWDDLVKGLVRQAKDELEGMLVRGIGELAPEIEGDDLDGRPMKLSNFRGKVVLVSFWATWCGPCMKLVPHEESLIRKLKDKPFAIVGVNGDDPRELSQALKKTPVTWRSFKNKRAGKKTIMNEWKILSFPTLYLIDHKGIIQKRWIGTPPTDELDREIGKLVEEPLREK